MIRLPATLALAAQDRQELQRRQQAIDTVADYATRVGLADQQWGTKPAALFERVRAVLGSECPGVCRCCYCEDSLSNEIDHIRPKSWFPEHVFDPDNYLFACGPCNGPKGNAYAVVDGTGALTEASRPGGSAVLPPPLGQEALLHPRRDDPADFFELDLANTFLWQPQLGLPPTEQQRAAYTLRVLRLNKDPLLAARKEAFRDFAARVKEYYLAERDGEPADQLQRRREELLRKQHLSVWREMQRQSGSSLKRLFDLVPEAATW